MERIMEPLLATEEKMDSHHERLMVVMKAGHEELMVIMKARSEEIESESEHQGIPKEETTAETIGALDD
jgi:hypothetical protein